MRNKLRNKRPMGLISRTWKMEPSAKLHSDFSYVDQRSQSRSYVQKIKVPTNLPRQKEQVWEIWQHHLIKHLHPPPPHHPYQCSGVHAYHFICNLASMVVDTLSVVMGSHCQSENPSPPPQARKTHSDHSYQGSGVRAYHSIYNLASMVEDFVIKFTPPTLSLYSLKKFTKDYIWNLF